jgi:hypothetical protein
MKLKHIPNKELGCDAIVGPQYKIHPKQRTISGKDGAIKTYSISTLFKH